MSMIRQVPRLAARLSVRPMSTTTARMSDEDGRTLRNDVGAVRTGAASQDDAFKKREQANEDYYVYNQERQKLEALKKKLAQQEQDLAATHKELENLDKKK